MVLLLLSLILTLEFVKLPVMCCPLLPMSLFVSVLLRLLPLLFELLLLWLSR
jgi:hypothetical protein